MKLPTSKDEYIRMTGKRISDGAWERMSRVYAVHAVKRVIHKMPDGEMKVSLRYTYTLHPQTDRFRRKKVRDYLKKNGPMDRYQKDPVGIVVADRRWWGDVA